MDACSTQTCAGIVLALHDGLLAIRAHMFTHVHILSHTFTEERLVPHIHEHGCQMLELYYQIGLSVASAFAQRTSHIDL